MAERTTPESYPFVVRQTLDTMPQFEKTFGIRGFENVDDANIDCADRNQRAERMGLVARYEVVNGS